MATNDFQVIYQHAGETPVKESYSNPDTAIGDAREAFKYGAEIAKVVRRSDGVVLYDGPGDVELDYREWNNQALANAPKKVSASRVNAAAAATGYSVDVVRAVLEADANR